MLTAPADDLARLGTVPPGVRALERYPLHALLPTCAAVVHHGGAGCVMTALDAGVPQLALTFAVEQECNGERVAGAGAGLQMRGHLAEPAAVRAAVTDLLAKPSFARSAAALRDDLRGRPTPASLVDQLAALAG